MGAVFFLSNDIGKKSQMIQIPLTSPLSFATLNMKM